MSAVISINKITITYIANTKLKGRGGIVARSRLRDRRLAESKPESFEAFPRVWNLLHIIIPSGQTSSRWFSAQCWIGDASSGAVFVI
ncbi:hypothetical protein AVEN_176914-1 [Araneus ventricosus]|uniref:Uncharacterized protein n=1 Tax=Araneus ventricosus TaxID=182803 RepID=A0A4Y2BG08_ARAVE|nr:hypothetical protein AVEN_176914-1 [Araneus ventricosus]